MNFIISEPHTPVGSEMFYAVAAKPDMAERMHLFMGLFQCGGNAPRNFIHKLEIQVSRSRRDTIQQELGVHICNRRVVLMDSLHSDLGHGNAHSAGEFCLKHFVSAGLKQTPVYGTDDVAFIAVGKKDALGEQWFID